MEYIVYNINTGGIIDTVNDYDLAVDLMTTANEAIGLLRKSRRFTKTTECELCYKDGKVITAPTAIKLR